MKNLNFYCNKEYNKTHNKALFGDTKNFNPVKKVYVEKWIDFLHKVYEKKYIGKDVLFKGQLPGVYIEKDGLKQRSLINNITANVSIFCLLTDYFNEHLHLNNEDPIIFNDDTKNNLNQIYRFFTVLEVLKDRIFFNPSSEVFRSIGKILQFTDALGKRTEEATKEIITQNLGENAIKLLSGMGVSNDMLLGIDAKLTLNGTEGTAQIKGFHKIYEETYNDERYTIVEGSVGARKYGTDLMIFTNVKNKETLIIESKGMFVKDSKFYFPISNNIQKLKALSPLNLTDCNKYLL